MHVPAVAFLDWADDDWVGHAANLAQLVAVALAIPAAFWAYRQLKAGTASAESQAILALDEAFGRFERLRKDLNQGLPVDAVELRRYVAVFERLGLLLRKRVVRDQLADQLYGSRFQKLLINNGGKLDGILKAREGKGWDNFMWLWERFRKGAWLRKGASTHRNLLTPEQLADESRTAPAQKAGSSQAGS